MSDLSSDVPNAQSVGIASDLEAPNNLPQQKPQRPQKPEDYWTEDGRFIPPVFRVFKPLLAPARYKGAHGGRGSGKSHFFADLLISRFVADPTLRAICIREVQKTLDQSVKKLLEDKIGEFGLESRFRILNTHIETAEGGWIGFQGMQNHNAVSVKSLEGCDIAWCEEAQTLALRSLNVLRPTIRKPNSELWFSWNPENDSDAVDRFLRGPNRPQGAIVVKANYENNPWLPTVLEDEIAADRKDPDKFGHVWLGEYQQAVQGAYFVDQLRQTAEEGRIDVLATDPILRKRAFWDLGVEDSMVIWIAQWVGSEIWWLDYFEGQGQPLSYYVNWLRSSGHGDALCIIPHDGARRDNVTALSFEAHLKAAEFDVRTIPNQGKGAARLRIEAARRLFPRMRFDADRTAVGRKALAAYHERRDEDRGIGLGPEHDWASHGADAFGLGCIAYEEPDVPMREDYQFGGSVGGGWLGS
jgi:phage terminase large subunit